MIFWFLVAEEPLLMLGDCLERMKEIPDGSVDMILCDLPYGVTQNKWDTPIPFEPMWAEYWRVLKPNGAAVLFSQMPFAAALVMSQRRMFRYEWIYEKTNPSGFMNANRMPMKYHENVLVFYRKLPKYNPIRRDGFQPYHKRVAGKSGHSTNYGEYVKRPDYSSPDGTRCPSDIIRIHNPSWGKDKGLHPTQKPVALCEYLIRTYTDEGETVMDNCMGSGTTGVACVNTGRRFIGIEKSPEYFEVARKRIAEAIERR